MSYWTWMWIAWGAAFALIEGTALFNDKADDTLSEHIRLWFRTDTKIGRSIWVSMSGVLMAWFVVHIAVANSI